MGVEQLKMQCRIRAFTSAITLVSEVLGIHVAISREAGCSCGVCRWTPKRQGRPCASLTAG